MEEKKLRISIAFSPDSRRLAAAANYSNEHRALVWEVPHPLSPPGTPRVLAGHSDQVSSVAFDARGRVATGSWDKTVKIWVGEGGEPLTLTSHTKEVRCVGFSPDGKWLASGSDDATARIWDAATGAHLRTLQGHEHAVLSVAFSPDSRWVITGSRDKTARIWDALTGRKLVLLQGQRAFVRSASFSPDGQLVVTAANNLAAVVWDALDGKKLFELPKETQDARGAAFSPDGRSILVAASHAASLWVLRDPYLVAQEMKPRDFTPEERERYLMSTADAVGPAPGPGR